MSPVILSMTMVAKHFMVGSMQAHFLPSVGV